MQSAAAPIPTWIKSVSIDMYKMEEVRLSREQLQDELKKFGGGSLRASPLFSVLKVGNQRHVFVGNASIFVRDDKTTVQVRLAEVATSDESGALTSHEYSRSRPLHAREHLELSKLEDHLRKRVLGLRRPKIGEDSYNQDEYRAAAIARRLSEDSVDAVSTMKGIRYDLERQLLPAARSSKNTVRGPRKGLAATLKAGVYGKTGARLATVSSLTLAGILVGKGADQAQQAVREGLWLHITQREGYHAYRRHQDPTLLRDGQFPNVDSLTWMPLHDSASRHCRSLESQLGKESESVRSLLAAASSISSARDADSQANLNLLVATVSISLGLPGLIFALYGVNNMPELQAAAVAVMPFSIPIAGIAILLAAILTFCKAPPSRWLPLAALGVLIALLQLALALPSQGSGRNPQDDNTSQTQGPAPS